ARPPPFGPLVAAPSRGLPWPAPLAPPAQAQFQREARFSPPVTPTSWIPPGLTVGNMPPTWPSWARELALSTVQSPPTSFPPPSGSLLAAHSRAATAASRCGEGGRTD